MQWFRELSRDDPHRRADRGRGATPTKDDGDLFTLRPSPRKLRILLDVESLSEPSSIDDLWNALLSYENVEVLRIRMSDTGNRAASNDDRDDHGFVTLRDVTDSTSLFAFPGRRYGWRIGTQRGRFDGSTVLGAHGSISPEPQLVNSLREFYDLSDDQRIGLTADDIERLVLLTETARAINYDLVISEATSSRCSGIAAHDRANVMTREQALPVAAHYLRRQQIYDIDPLASVSVNRTGYYMETVGAVAPGIWHWLAKCELSAAAHHSSRRYLADGRSMIGVCPGFG